MKLCKFKPCSKEFEPKTKRAEYCSGSCRAQDSVLRKATGLTGVSPVIKTETSLKAMEIAKPTGMDLQTQYVFDSQKKEIDRWEKAYNDERTRRKAVEADKAKVAEELATLKTDKMIAEQSKPSGLAGVMENPLVSALMPHVGPALGNVLAKIMENTMLPKQMQGAPESDPAGEWVMKQPLEVQNGLRNLIGKLADLETPDKVLQALERFKNQLDHTKPNTSGSGPLKTGTI
jgi:hypothetical protein